MVRPAQKCKLHLLGRRTVQSWIVLRQSRNAPYLNFCLELADLLPSLQYKHSCQSCIRVFTYPQFSNSTCYAHDAVIFFANDLPPLCSCRWKWLWRREGGGALRTVLGSWKTECFALFLARNLFSAKYKFVWGPLFQRFLSMGMLWLAL